MYRSTFVEIDNNKLKNNVKEIIKKYHKYKYYIGVVKANAYGHGDYIVNDLIASGINYLAVSSLEEAISIRKYNKEIPILCLEPINIKYLKEVILNNVTITITSINYVKELIRKENLDKLKVHLKLDTGMNRLGIKSKEEVTEIVTLLNDNNIVHINKFMVVLSAFTLTVTIGVVWEIVEFGIDGIFGTNMQRAYNSISGEAFIGRKALIDTMKDLILDICGALFVCTICGLIIKKRGKVPKLLMSYKI